MQDQTSWTVLLESDEDVNTSSKQDRDYTIASATVSRIVLKFLAAAHRPSPSAAFEISMVILNSSYGLSGAHLSGAHLA